jgi:hypothetical protein
MDLEGEGGCQNGRLFCHFDKIEKFPVQGFRVQRLLGAPRRAFIPLEGKNHELLNL